MMKKTMMIQMIWNLKKLCKDILNFIDGPTWQLMRNKNIRTVKILEIKMNC